MDTVDFVLLTLAGSLLLNAGLTLLAWRYQRIARKAQREVVLLVALSHFKKESAAPITMQSLCETQAVE
jgi:hypothetical protein